MVVPCMVNSASYAPGSRNVLRGTASWMRISSASSPPIDRRSEAGDQIQDADVFVVDGRDPAQQAAGRGVGHAGATGSGAATVATTSGSRGSRPARSGPRRTRLPKAGIETPGLTAAGCGSTRRRFCGRIGQTTPVPSVERLPKCVRSGPTAPVPGNPRMAWQLTHVFCTKTCSPRLPPLRNGWRCCSAPRRRTASRGSATTTAASRRAAGRSTGCTCRRRRPADRPDRHPVGFARHGVAHPAELRHVKAVDHVADSRSIVSGVPTGTCSSLAVTTARSGYSVLPPPLVADTRSGWAPGAAASTRAHGLDDQHEDHDAAAARASASRRFRADDCRGSGVARWYRQGVARKRTSASAEPTHTSANNSPEMTSSKPNRFVMARPCA